MAQKTGTPGLLGLIYFFARIVSTTIFNALIYPFSTRRAPNFTKQVYFSAIRIGQHIVTIQQSRYLSLLTTQRYVDFCSKQRIAPRSLHFETTNQEDASSHGVAHWLGDPDADIIVMYLHGGGFTQPASEPTLLFWSRLIQDLNTDGKSKTLALLLLSYSLAPEAVYPTQLQEATMLLTHLITKEGRSPSSIIISGDSAGGNLCLALLSHMLHPHPNVTEIKLVRPLSGALLISPWVSFSTEDGSISRNYYTDFVAPSCLRRWSAMYLGKSRGDPEADQSHVSGDSYSEPAVSTAGWWKGIHNVVNDMLVWSGGGEIFADHIKDFGRVLRGGWEKGGGDPGRALFVEIAGRAHIEPIMSAVFEPNVKGEHQVVVQKWLQARLQR